MKAAMKAREEGKVRLTTIRMVRAAIKNAEIAQGRPPLPMRKPYRYWPKKLKNGKIVFPILPVVVVMIL